MNKNGKTEKQVKPKAGVFVDASNTYFSEKRAGWKIDYAKLRVYLSQEFAVEFMRYYVAVPNKSDKEAYKGKMSYLEKIRDAIEVIEKPLKYIKEKIVIDGKTISRVIRKGDVDVDITVDVMNNAPDLDVVIILSGDSDYLALRNDIIGKRKKILFMAHKRNLSTELTAGKYITFNRLRKFIEFGKKESPASKGGGTLVPLLYSNQKKSQAKMV